MGAWIEITVKEYEKPMALVAPLVGAWIEILRTVCNKVYGVTVAPLVGAWIEIVTPSWVRLSIPVAPLVGAWIEILNG